jgi:hypothetical protein
MTKLYYKYGALLFLNLLTNKLLLFYNFFNLTTYNKNNCKSGRPRSVHNSGSEKSIAPSVKDQPCGEKRRLIHSLLPSGSTVLYGNLTAREISNYCPNLYQSLPLTDTVSCPLSLSLPLPLPLRDSLRVQPLIRVITYKCELDTYGRRWRRLAAERVSVDRG